MFSTVILLMCVLGGRALDLLRAKETSRAPPSAPRVHCWCASYPNVTLCSWPEPSLSPPTHYVATYSERHGQSDARKCHFIPPSSSPSVSLSPSSSSSSSSSSPSVQLWQLPKLKLLTDYIINITAVYPGGSSSYLSSFMLEDIVRPDPPVDVRVSPHNNRDLMVEWSPPSTWSDLDLFPLKYQIMYRWEIRGVPKSVNLGPFESSKVELKGLSPGRTYLFQVCARELLGLGRCSSWSSPVKATTPRPRP